MTGTCEMSPLSSVGVSGVVPIVSVTGFAWLPDEIRGRIGEVLSSRDLGGGEEVEAFDAIDCRLPLASRSAVPKSIIRNAFESVAVNSRVSDEHDMCKEFGQLVPFRRRVKNSTQDRLFRHTTNGNTACKLSRVSFRFTLLTGL